MTTQELREVIAAHRQGKEVEYLSSSCGRWEKVVGMFDNPVYYVLEYEYRIKPTPTLRPWKDATEVPPAGFLIQFEQASFINGSYLVIARDYEGLVYSNTAADKPSLVKSLYKNLLGAKYSLDHGKTWLPCGVYE